MKHTTRRPARRLSAAITVLAAVSLSSLAMATAAGAKPSPLRSQATASACSRPSVGGDWTSYGHDLANTRSQPEEHGLTPGVAASLAPAWVFSTREAGEMGQAAFNSTPVIEGGCVFIGSGGGTVYALGADTGSVVWRTTLPVVAPGTGGAIVGSVAVADGRVLVLVNQLDGPYAAALDKGTGAVLWKSQPVDSQPGAYTNASAMVFKGVLFMGFSPTEGDSGGQGGFALIDARTGAILKKTYTVPPADQALGYAGGGLWATPAVDPVGRYAYIGSGNPNSKMIEHPHTNAILKIDMASQRRTFGTIVGSYKGNIDQYLPSLQVLSQTPVCRDTEPLFDPSPIDSPACGQLDLDFGASPNLFVDSQGRTLVGELQKSGVYHVADTATMEGAWTALMGLSCFLCNAASTAYDGAAVYGVGTPGGVMSALEADTGTRRWAQPIADGIHYQSTSTAAGVVYVVDANGLFHGFDAASGMPVLRRSTVLDIGARDVYSGLGSNGVAIARHSVYAAINAGMASGYVIAYRPS